jgi:hypothetical protein
MGNEPTPGKLLTLQLRHYPTDFIFVTEEIGVIAVCVLSTVAILEYHRKLIEEQTSRPNKLKDC